MVETPLCTAELPTLAGKKIAVVPILRAGLGLVDGVLRMIPSARVGHIGMFRDEQTLVPHTYFCKLPKDIADREVMVVDPMLATGGSADAALAELKKRGYREDSAAALVAAAGTIGVVIPPSVPMVLYAVIAEESVSRLFSAGFLPGVIMGMMLIAIALYQAYQNNYPKGAPFSLKNVGKTFLKAIPGILMPAIILGGIFSGYFTPSEAAAVAVVYALLVSTFVYRDMSLKKLYTTMLGSAKTSAVIMIIIACSGPFGWALANWKIPEAISSAVLSVSTNKYVILFLISLIILVAGVFMETSSAIIILTPVFLPLVRALGISTLHFGILFVVGIAIGMITPPVAINLFVASGITGLSLEKISKAVVPYLIGLIVVFLAIVYLPLFIPGFIG